MGEDLGYLPLLEEPQKESPASWGLPRRLAVVMSGVAACLLNAGLAFGFSALFPALVDDAAAFHDACPPGATEVCYEQVVALTGMFTLATSMLNVAALPTGVVLDSLGPRHTATGFALLVAAGTATFARGGAGPEGHFAFYAGFLLMAVSGPVVFNCTLSFGSLFPGRQGLITAALVGSFDASSAIFVGLAAVISGGVSFRDAFEGYSLVPTATAVVAFLLWPAKAVPAASKEGAGCPSAASALLAELSARRQICSAEFGLLAHTVAVTMVCINFFIATVPGQLAAIDPSSSRRLTGAFALFLPAGGILHIPITGKIIDAAGPIVGFVVLWAFYILFQIFLAAYTATGAHGFAYAAFACFAFVRPLFYTLGAVFCGRVFGFATFGKVYGTTATIAGFANFLVQPLGILGSTRGFGVANAVVLAAQLTTAALPVLMFIRSWRTEDADQGLRRTTNGVWEAARSRAGSTSSERAS